MSTIIIEYNCIKEKHSFLPGENLLELLRGLGYRVSAPCGGNGTCGKCTVLLDGVPVLACRTTLSKSCTVCIPSENGDISWNDAAPQRMRTQSREGFGAAVDLGTTTVALTLYDLSEGQSIASASEWNVQTSYGGDVITRIGYCIDHPNGLSELCSLIRAQVFSMLKQLAGAHGVLISQIRELFVAGNTVMQHIFAGISPASIAAAPFTPESFFENGQPLLIQDIPVYFSPCVAGYVGGDITAGLLSCDLRHKSGISLFIDVGTNGEMALGGPEGFLTCAVASGPAFEGAGIRCGMHAAAGAVNSVSLCGDELRFEVLGGGTPTGICGSGLLDLVACLLDLGFIDESGCLAEDENGETTFYLTPDVYITQQDIRQLQLAKAAVAAGIRILLKTAGLSPADVDKLYLAGGFGNRLRPESAVRIGMLPAGLLSKTVACGNSSLSGAIQALVSPADRLELNNIKANCTYLELSSNPSFNDCFVDEMSFPE